MFICQPGAFIWALANAYGRMTYISGKQHRSWPVNESLRSENEQQLGSKTQNEKPCIEQVRLLLTLLQIFLCITLGLVHKNRTDQKFHNVRDFHADISTSQI